MPSIDYIIAMTISLTYLIGPFLIAFAAAIALPTSMIVVNSTTKTIPNHVKLTTIIGAIVIGDALTVAFSGRKILGELEQSLHPAILTMADADAGNSWFSRIAHLLILSLSVSEIFSWVIQKNRLANSIFPIWLISILYFFITVVLSGIVGEYREYSIKTLYAPIVFTATALLIGEDFRKFLTYLRLILFFPLVCSIILIYFAPSLVIEPDYKSIIPGFSVRLSGLAEHANSLGAMAAIALLLESTTYARAKANPLLLLASIACLILAQSKTAWLIVVGGFILLLLAKPKPESAQKLHSSVPSSILIAITGIVVLISIIIWKLSSIVEFFNFDNTGILTFTGRTKIWEITINEFVKQPVFGYGPALWDPLYRHMQGMLFVGQAHNQFIQTLGQAGAVGEISLLVYLGIFAKRGFQGWTETQGFSLVMFSVLFLRCFSESPMRMIGILDTDGFIHLLTFAIAASIGYKGNAKTSRNFK